MIDVDQSNKTGVHSNRSVGNSTASVIVERRNTQEVGMHRIDRVWARLTSPSPHIREPKGRRQAALLASLFLGLLVFGVIAQVIALIGESADHVTRQLTGALITIILVGLAYWLSRTRFYLAAAIAFVIVFDAWIFAIASNSVPNILVYLLAPALLSSVLISTRMTLALTAVNLLGASLIVTRTPGVQLADGISAIIAPLVMVTALFVIVARHRDRLEQEQRAELEVSHQRYQTLVQSIFEGVVTTHAGRIMEANTGFVRLVGAPGDNVLGQPLDRYLPEADKLLTAQVDNGLALETHGATYGGQRIDVEVVVRPDTYNGQPAFVVALRDVSEKKRAAAALFQAQRLESLGLLAGGIAHDFNNMLTGILMQGSLALHKLVDNTPARSHLEKMLDSAERAAQLTRQLLAYAGKGRIEVELFDLNAVIRNSDLFLNTSLPRQVALEMHLASDPLFIRGDKGQMQQILLNFVINAAEATTDIAAGQIHITTSPYELQTPEEVGGYIDGANLPPGPYIRLEVSDNGHGMNKETQTRIFDPFYTTKSNGHGLGLASTLGIVRSHHGAITVESEPGKGTRFTVLLPRVTGQLGDAVQ